MVLEPLNPWRDHPGMFLARSPHANLVCKAVNSPSCKILFDIYHQQITEGNLIPNIERCWDQIGYFQAGDNPGRKEPGTGEINYRNVFAHIHDKDFEGVIDLINMEALFFTGKGGDQVDSLQRLEIFPSIFPMHTFYWGDWHRDSVLGPERAENISPTGWVLERGMMFGSHHDAPVALPDSMRVLSATVTRRTRTAATPLLSIPSWAAAPRDRSMIRPATNGPRSFSFPGVRGARAARRAR